MPDPDPGPMPVRSARKRIAFAAALMTSLATLALTSAAVAFRFEATLTPDVPGAPTNLSGAMTFAEGAIPQPLREVVAFAPAGLELDLRNVVACTRAKLEARGPRGCPLASRIGFGGGVGVVKLGEETIREPYALDFFLAPRERGRLAILVYVSAVAPVSLQFVLVARETRGSSPYGLGLAVSVPAISTVPGAADAAVESSYVSLGGADVAYYRTVHGARRLVHVRGLLAPRSCRAGGLHFQALASFQDGMDASAEYVTPCRGRHR